MLCSDNFLTSPYLFKQVHKKFKTYGAVYEKHYAYLKEDNSLNRYFSLMGGNDPVCYFMGKNDRQPWVKELEIHRGVPSIGDNGCFVAREWFKFADLNHYYAPDAHIDMQGNRDIFKYGLVSGIKYHILNQGTVWHRTSDSFWSFMKKRYKYARDLYCERNDRRWKVIDSKKDYWRLIYFILASACIIPFFLTSCRGYSKIRDPAWFWHPVVCLAFLITYGVLACRNLALSCLRGGVPNLFSTARKVSTIKPIKILKSS